MKNQLKRKKKLEKKKNKRKDYERKMNINKQSSSEIKVFEKDIMDTVKDEEGELKTKNGRVILKKVGTQLIPRRVKKTRKDEDGNDLPFMQFPKSKKTKLNKSEIKNRKEADKNVIETVT